MAEQQGPSTSQLLAVAWGLGWRIAAGLLIGGYLDGKLSTAPFLALTLSMVALVSGVRHILKLLESSNSRGHGSGEDDETH